MKSLLSQESVFNEDTLSVPLLDTLSFCDDFLENKKCRNIVLDCSQISSEPFLTKECYYLQM